MEAIALLAFVYALPALNAWKRKHHNAAAITALNVLLGWTILGWVAALVWSFTATPPHPPHRA